MDGMTVFTFEVLLSIAISATILVRLQSLLRRIGSETCEHGPSGGTEFWIAYTQLMMLIAPLLLVSWLSHAGHFTNLVDQLRSSLYTVLLGQFIGLALVGRAVWKTIVKPPAPSAAPAIPATAAH
jgi:hypothetical protein